MMELQLLEFVPKSVLIFIFGSSVPGMGLIGYVVAGGGDRGDGLGKVARDIIYFNIDSGKMGWIVVESRFTFL